MKKVILVSILIVLLVGLTFAQEKKGGVAPCLASCLVGPRVGLEMNEGQDVYQSEWIALGGALVGGAMGGAVGAGLGGAIATGTRAYNAYEMGAKPNGFEGALASFFLGSRVGNELHYRKVRTVEWLTLVPCIQIVPIAIIALEAFNGQTMTEIEVKEGLRK